MGTSNCETRGLRYWWVAIVAIAAAFGIAVCLSGCGSQSDQGKQGKKSDSTPVAEETAEMPNVMGMTKDDATRTLQSLDFKLGNVTEEASDAMAAGYVVSQSVKASSQAKKGSSVDLVIAKAKAATVEQVLVPDLSGMTQTQAEQALAAVKLIAKAEDPVAADGVAPGKIFKQSAAAGTKVDQGTVVSFTAALGTEVVAVPNVGGMSKDDAIKALVAVAFNVDVYESYSPTAAAGTIISQNPNARIQCVKGTTVTLCVSKGAAPTPKEQVIVPDLKTLALDQAQSVCSSAGLVCKETGDEQGIVVAQSIAAGTKVDSGTTITVTLKELYQ